MTVSSRAEGMVMEDAALLRLGLQRPATLRCQTYVSAFAIVASSDHLLTAPELMSREVPGANALQRWRMPFQFPKMHLHLYWHAHNETDPANQWLRSVVLGVVKERGQRKR